MTDYQFSVKFEITNYHQFTQTFLHENCSYCNSYINLTGIILEECSSTCVLHNLTECFHVVCKDFCEKNSNFQYMKQFAPVISSLDGKNRLIMDITVTSDDLKNNVHCITFSQQSLTGDFFTLEELKTICKNIQKESKKYITIDHPILFIDVKNILGWGIR